MIADILLVLAGVTAVLAGGLAARRLRRWRPKVKPDQGVYDPGPDAIDWLQVAALATLGVVLVVAAVAV